MGIYVDTVRVKGFRGLENIEVTLDETTVLTGMNNSGKTSFLKALQLIFGNNQFISKNDFFSKNNSTETSIVIDALIKPADKTAHEFSQLWQEVFTQDRIMLDSNYEKQVVPVRTVIELDPIKNNYVVNQAILKSWPEYQADNGKNWFEYNELNNKSFKIDEIGFLYIDAKRDILDDLRKRTSYLGRMFSRVEYSEEDATSITALLAQANKQAVDSSEILGDLAGCLSELNTSVGTKKNRVILSSVPTNIDDLSKNIDIHYAENEDHFSMEYQGMGTRSWSSLLAMKAYLNYIEKLASHNEKVFFPILAIEEPETHLHPNAQKNIYSQMSEIKGQKIISTHSPYVVAGAKLSEIRHLHKGQGIKCSKLYMDDLTDDDRRRLRHKVIKNKGDLFFSELIVLFEGECENQCLPLLYKKHFRTESFCDGINFVAVDGHGCYKPFLRFAKYFQINWLIFSDAEKNILTSVRQQICEVFDDTNFYEERVVKLTDDCNFEKELVNEGYGEELRKACADIYEFKNEAHREKKLPQLMKMSDDELMESLSKSKTKYPEYFVARLVESKKKLPSKVRELFDKIKPTVSL